MSDINRPITVLMDDGLQATVRAIDYARMRFQCETEEYWDTIEDEDGAIVGVGLFSWRESAMGESINAAHLVHPAEGDRRNVSYKDGSPLNLLPENIVLRGPRMRHPTARLLAEIAEDGPEVAERVEREAAQLPDVIDGRSPDHSAALDRFLGRHRQAALEDTIPEFDPLR